MGLRIEIDGRWLNGFIAGVLTSASVYFITATESGAVTRKLVAESIKAGMRLAGAKYREKAGEVIERLRQVGVSS